MNARGTIIAALCVLELAILGEAGVATRGDALTQSRASLPGLPALPQHRAAAIANDSHQHFAVGAQPALTVDIGYADLTIVTGDAAQIDVDVRDSRDFGPFRARGPITASKTGDEVRIAAEHQRRWSMGDDRMVRVVVPPGTRVTVLSAGDITASGLRADASFRSVGNGTIAIDDYDARVLHVASSDGRIALHGVAAARLDATSTGSRIEATGLRVRDGEIRSDERISLGFAAGSDTLVTANAGDGNVDLSGFDGSNAEDDASSRTVRVGAGNGRLDVHANDATIRLVREN
jgi:hypothetical protein